MTKVLGPHQLDKLIRQLEERSITLPAAAECERQAKMEEVEMTGRRRRTGKEEEREREDRTRQ
eukprot:717035-Hanusia_phi.AAC.1